MCAKPLIFIFCLLIASDALAVRWDGSRAQNYRNTHIYYGNGGLVIQQYNGYANPYVDGSTFNPNDAYSYQDQNGNLIYYTTDLDGNTVYFRYNDEGKIIHVNPLESRIR